MMGSGRNQIENEQNELVCSAGYASQIEVGEKLEKGWPVWIQRENLRCINTERMRRLFVGSIESGAPVSASSAYPSRQHLPERPRHGGERCMARTRVHPDDGANDGIVSLQLEVSRSVTRTLEPVRWCRLENSSIAQYRTVEEMAEEHGR